MDDPEPPQQSSPPRQPLPRSRPMHDDGDVQPERKTGLPTWAWVVISLVLLIVGLPLLGALLLFLFCLFSGPMRF